MVPLIKNIAIQGGGIRAIAYVGALKELSDQNKLNTVLRFAGTSAGALVASLLAVGYTVGELITLMSAMDIRKFKMGYNPFRIFTKYGIHSGNYILSFVRDAIAKAPGKNFRASSTFRELHEKGAKELYIFATNMNDLSIMEFSFTNTPDLPVAEAVRASMSIPIYFKAWRFSEPSHSEHLYADGGIAYNYPLSFFDSERFLPAGEIVNSEAIGLYLQTPKTVTKFLRPLGFNTPVHYIAHLFETLLKAQSIDFGMEPEMENRTIIIDDLGIAATDFAITSEDQQRLVASGKKAAQAYITKQEKIPEQNKSRISEPA